MPATENYFCMEEDELNIAGQAFQAIVASPEVGSLGIEEDRLRSLAGLFVLGRVKAGESAIEAIRSEGLRVLKQNALNPRCPQGQVPVRELIIESNRMRLEFLNGILQQLEGHEDRSDSQAVNRNALVAQIEQTAKRLADLRADTEGGPQLPDQS